MPNYKITLEVDEGWLKAITDLTDVDIHEGEVMRWITKEETTNA